MHACSVGSRAWPVLLQGTVEQLQLGCTVDMRKVDLST